MILVTDSHLILKAQFVNNHSQFSRHNRRFNKIRFSVSTIHFFSRVSKLSNAFFVQMLHCFWLCSHRQHQLSHSSSSSTFEVNSFLWKKMAHIFFLIIWLYFFTLIHCPWLMSWHKLIYWGFRKFYLKGAYLVRVRKNFHFFLILKTHQTKHTKC